MIESDNQYGFIELNRTFQELSEYSSETDEVDLSHAFVIGSHLKWSDLLREHRVVLLSEAGSGKTEEIRNIAQKIGGEGKASFFVRLEHISNDFEDAFEVGSFELFEEWIASGEEGWLLLDSVDEARLRSPGDFELAIRKLGRKILTAKDRIHIIITGRTYAWRPKTDLDLCKKYLPITNAITTIAEQDQTDNSAPPKNVHSVQKGNKPDSLFKVVALRDLTPDQVGIFARARGIKDTTAFLHAVERADAWSFTSRPQDLEELAEFWIDKGRIGSRLELMQNSIVRRLTERDQDRADTRPLSMEDARLGAQMLAAAATLGQEPTIRIPDGAENTKGISVREVLPRWDDGKQAALLSRPIFDEAIYGSVRFHHRSVREYLTAEWLAALLERETSRRKIEALFFANQYGLDVIIPTLRPVLPWLAILDNKVRERLRKIAPEVVFEGGDPRQLPLDTRRTILHEVCEQMASGTSSRSVADYAAVQRFSSADLTDDIRILIGKYSDNDDLLSFLLRMIWIGELKSALPEAKAAALKASLSTYARIAAFRAVKAIGSEGDFEEVRQALLQETSEVKREWLAELVQDATPTADTISWFLAALEKAAEANEHVIDHLKDSVEEFVRRSDMEHLPEIISCLNNLLDHKPVIEKRFCEVSVKFRWLLKGAALAVERLMQKRHPAALESSALSILRKYQACQEYYSYDSDREKIEFSTLVSDWSELNRTKFWHDVQEVRKELEKKRGERLTEFWRVSIFGAYWKFTEEDFDYVVEQITNQRHGDNRLVAVSLAFKIYNDSGRPKKWREQLKRLVAEDEKLSGRLNTYLKPPAKSKESQTWKQQEAAWKRLSKQRERKEKKNRDDWEKYFSENIEKIRDPGLSRPESISNAQYYLHQRLREKEMDSNRWTSGNWKYLIDEYGNAVAQAFRDGAVAYWRRYKPKLQSEGAPRNQTPFSVIFGLVGLSIEARETTGWPSTLSEIEIDIACRYASLELNGFPVWFPQLFEAHPKIVGDFLLKEIRYELSIETPDEETNYILSDVSWSGEWAWNVIAPELLEILRTREPVNLKNLQKLLTIIQGSSIEDGEIGNLASNRVKKLRRHTHLAQWYAVWTGVDPENAIPSFATRIAKISKKQDRANIAMIYVTSLWGGRRTGATRVRTSFQTPEHLKSLYLLMHEYVRREEDIERAGKGVYSPGLRDHAQDARNSLFTILNQISGKEAFLALEAISRVHPEESSRSWFVLHAKTKAEHDADISSWAPSQVREFHDKLERTPSNHKELSELASMRLLDLKDDLEHGDSSVAKILQGVTLETDIRKYIGNQLRDKAFGRYSIPQEEELADAKRPDLRFLGCGFDGPVPAELKLADNWTGPALFERLENQLCGDYLRDNRSNRGIFVLVYRGEKKGWDIPGFANRVDFEELINALGAHWEQISGKFAGVEGVTIVGIDLTKRLQRVGVTR